MTGFFKCDICGKEILINDFCACAYCYSTADLGKENKRCQKKRKLYNFITSDIKKKDKKK